QVGRGADGLAQSGHGLDQRAAVALAAVVLVQLAGEVGAWKLSPTPRQRPGRQRGRAHEGPFLLIVVGPRRRERVQVSTDPPFHAGPFESLAVGCLLAVAGVLLVALTAPVAAAQPLAAEAKLEGAADGAVGILVIAVLPAADADDGVEAVHHVAGVDVTNGQGTTAADLLGLPADGGRRERGRQGGGDAGFLGHVHDPLRRRARLDGHGPGNGGNSGGRGGLLPRGNSHCFLLGLAESVYQGEQLFDGVYVFAPAGTVRPLAIAVTGARAAPQAAGGLAEGVRPCLAVEAP